MILKFFFQLVFLKIKYSEKVKSNNYINIIEKD